MTKPRFPDDLSRCLQKSLFAKPVGAGSSVLRRKLEEPLTEPLKHCCILFVLGSDESQYHYCICLTAEGESGLPCISVSKPQRLLSVGDTKCG